MILGLIVSLAVVVIFFIRSVHYAPHLRENEPIRPWMTLPYIAHAYHVPVSILCQSLRIPQLAHDKRPLMQIARQQHLPVNSLITSLQNAIDEYQHQFPTIQPSPTPGKP